MADIANTSIRNNIYDDTLGLWIVFVIFGIIIAIGIIITIIYVNQDKNNGNNRLSKKNETYFNFIIGISTVSFVILAIILFYYYKVILTGLYKESTLLTSLARLTTKNQNLDSFREGLETYLNGKLGEGTFDKKDIKSLGGLLGTNIPGVDYLHQLPSQLIPKAFINNMSRDEKNQFDSNRQAYLNNVAFNNPELYNQYYSNDTYKNPTDRLAELDAQRKGYEIKGIQEGIREERLRRIRTAREQTAREQTAREQTAREQTAREQTAREQEMDDASAVYPQSSATNNSEGGGLLSSLTNYLSGNL